MPRVRSLSKRFARLKDRLADNVNDLLIGVSRRAGLPAESRLKRIGPEKGRAVVWVPLDSIQTYLPNKALEKIFDPHPVRKPNIPSFFWKGDWDRMVEPVGKRYAEVNSHYRSVWQIFREGRPFRECDEYIEKKKALEQGVSSVRGTSVEELDRYFEELIGLEKRIRIEGYRSQQELGGDRHDEIGVFVGRDGSLIKAQENFSGTHRFALARYLELETVPVCILAVHYDWALENDHLLPDNVKELEKYFSDS